MIEGHAGTKVLTVWVAMQLKADDQLGEEAKVSPVARAVVPQVWQLGAPFAFVWKGPA